MAENRKIKLAERILTILISVIVLLSVGYGIYYIYITNFAFNDPVFVGGHDFSVTERITDEDMEAVTTILKENEIPYRVNRDKTSIFVQHFKWEIASDLLENSGIEFDGIYIT